MSGRPAMGGAGGGPNGWASAAFIAVPSIALVVMVRRVLRKTN